MLIPFDLLWKKYGIKSKDVLHLGANDGQEGEAYHKHGVERVIWVEAVPKIHLQLVTKLALSRWPEDKALCACLSDVDGKEITFNITNNQGQSSSFLEFGTHNKEHPTVKYVSQMKLVTTRVDTLLRKRAFAIRNGAFLKQFDYAYIEVNQKELYLGCPMVEEIDAFLAPLGLLRRETKWTGNGWGDAIYTKG